jgi:preprotein translocase subunit YajC
MILAADYPFLDVLGTIIVFFAWVAWFWAVVTVLGDVFRRHDLSGWGKAAWSLLIIIVPFLGVFIYLLAHGQDMARRNAEAQQTQQAQMDEYIRKTAGGSAGEIAKAKELLDSGAIDQAEFDAIKKKALA